MLPSVANRLTVMRRHIREGWTLKNAISDVYQRHRCQSVQYISVINLYMFRAVLLLISRRYYSVYTAIGVCQSSTSIYFQFTTVIDLYMFRAVLLLIIRMYYSVYMFMLTGCWQPAASQHKHMTYTNCCIYTVVPPDDEQ